jgi:tetratricopeptide (TPR) repeat protein
VFWVHASNAGRFEQSFRDIANRVKVFGRRDPKANIFNLLHNWLCNSREKWLLVLDNVDDARFLLDRPPTDAESTSRPLCEYLPQCDRGSILMTTRDKGAAWDLVENRDIIAVDPMVKPEAIALFEKKLGAQEDDNDITELAAALEYMPLAIVQAAAYILQRAPRCSVEQYLNEFRKSERKRTTLLNRSGGQLRRDREAKNSIVITWQISFEHIQKTRPSAADLLSLMSLFDRQGIPQTLLQSRTEQEDVQKGQEQRSDDDRDSGEDEASQSSTSEDEFEDDVEALRNYCFISVDTDGTSFEMHALVQLATREWLNLNGKLERWRQQSISNLYATFPTGEFKNWAICQSLYAHAKYAARQQPKGESSCAQWGTLLYHAAWYAWKIGNIADAEKLAVKSTKARRKILGQEHKDTLSSMGMAGLACRDGGRWKEAEVLEVQVMETSRRVLGEEHPDTLASMGNLASTYWYQGRWKEAEELNVQVIETGKRVLGEEHPDTLISMSNLASTYRNQGRWKEAEELEEQVIETSRRVLGEEHPDTLDSMENLSSTYRNQGRWKEAEELDVQVVEKRKTVLGEEHPDTLISMGNLSSTYWKQGRWKEAEELEVQVIETRKTVLGEEHPDTLASMGNLASTYRNQGRWKEAEELEVQVIETSRRVLGEEHPDTLASMGNLASTYWYQGRWKEAEELNVQVIETGKRVLGEEHPDTLTSMVNLSYTWKSQSRNEEAISLLERSFQFQKRILGSDHPDTEHSLEALTIWQTENSDKEI